MEYNDLYYYDNNEGIINTLRRVRERITHDDPIGGRTFKRVRSTNGLDLIIQGLLYFLDRSCEFREVRIRRNDWLDQFVIHEPETLNSTPVTEALKGTPDSITLCTVAGQVTEFFEHTLQDLNPLYGDIENNPYSEESWQELNGLSLALKCSPRHRVRVYKYSVKEKDTATVHNHFIIYSAKAFLEDDALLKRKVYAAIPYMLGFEEGDTAIPIFRDLEHIACDDWVRTVSEYLNTVDKFVRYERHQLIQNFDALNNMRRNSLERRKDVIDNELNDILNRYRNKLHDQRELLNEIAGLTDTGLSIEDINLLIDKKIIRDLTLRDRESIIEFTVTSPVLSFEKPAAERYYQTISDEETVYKALIKHAFIDEDIILFFSDRVRINFTTYDFSARENIFAPNGAYLFRNPHHRHYNCWGGYSSTITKLISEFNYMQLFMQIKAGVGSINMTDYTVLSRFNTDVNLLYDASNQPEVIMFKDNPSRRYTLREAVEIWKQQEVNKE